MNAISSALEIANETTAYRAMQELSELVSVMPPSEMRKWQTVHPESFVRAIRALDIHARHCRIMADLAEHAKTALQTNTRENLRLVK